MATPNHLLNTSWTSHRLSPLHHSQNHESLLTNTSALQVYAARLRDHLTNSFADAQGYGADENPSAVSGLASIGALQSCTWESISTLSFLNPGHGVLEGPDPVGLLITLIYETTTYKAALLAPPYSESQQGNKKTRKQTRASSGSSSSTYLPLLLTKLPKPLRESFLSFLSSNFDTYVSVLKIPPSALCDMLEGYVSALTTSDEASANSEALLEDVIREMQLTLSFAPPIAPSLKALNVNIPRETFRKFLRAPNFNAAGENGRSVLSSLSAYLKGHLALDAGLPEIGGSPLAGGYVKVTRVACAGFVVTGEGRVKIVAKGLGDGEEGDDERNGGALRGGEALLRALLERAATGIERGGES
ncbi:kinetochore complex Sim4 subunit Fta1-domain-containing protein [Aspergillus karnatakaensis]|uniref:uncharacterized protein n=1 Tax=Aspergillus karnatakaensis TaxID=1810916 RepID=UPI003CCE4B5B